MTTPIDPRLLLAAALGLAAFAYYLVRTSRSLSWGLLVIIFFMPFERIPSLTLAGVTFKINHFLGGLLMLIWLLDILFNRRKILVNPLTPWLLFFSSTLLYSLPIAQSGSRALVVTIVSFFTIGLGLLVAQLVSDEHEARQVVTVLGATTFLVALFGLFQFGGDLVGLPMALTGLDPGYTKAVFGFPRIQAFSQEPLYLGNFLLVPMSLALAFVLLPAQRWFKRSSLILLLMLTGLVFVLTLSRGAYLGLAVSLVVLLIFNSKYFFRPKILMSLLAGLVVAIVGAAVILAALGPVAQERFINQATVKDFGKSESTSGRLVTWDQAIKLWRLSPIVGIGMGNFGPATLGYPPIRPEHGWPIVNNEYLELLAETGLVGLGAFVVFILVLLLRSVRALMAAKSHPEMRAMVLGLTAAFVGILAQYNFFSTLYINPIWITVGLLMGAQTVALAQRHKEAV